MKLITAYAALGRFANIVAVPLINPLAKRSTRVRALVLSSSGEVLLTRSWLGYQQWSLPGGGVKRGEQLHRAAAREVFEETMVLTQHDNFVALGKFTSYESSSPFTVHCFKTDTKKQAASIKWSRRHEILQVGWFKIDELPKNTSKNVVLALQRYLQNK